MKNIQLGLFLYHLFSENPSLIPISAPDGADKGSVFPKGTPSRCGEGPLCISPIHSTSVSLHSNLF